MEVKGLIHATTILSPGKETPITITYEVGWVSEPFDAVKNRKFFALPEIEPQFLCYPSRSQSLYRLTYPDFSMSLY
jgi:hypothetical protein